MPYKSGKELTSFVPRHSSENERVSDRSGGETARLVPSLPTRTKLGTWDGHKI